MTAVISNTDDPLYHFFLPITAWSWNKLGIDVLCFSPGVNSPEELYSDKEVLAATTYMDHCKFVIRGYFNSPADKTATYAQCSRLYGATLPFSDGEVLVTGDIDMAVFNKRYFEQLNDGSIHVVGVDLVPDGQYPICYVAMPSLTWQHVMAIGIHESHQMKLDQLLGHLDCEHFRGNYWAKDQETIFNALNAGDWIIIEHERAKPGTQFANRRADRDGWPEVIPLDIIDAHLPRPGYTPENFAKILNLFQTMYPEDDFQWMIDYRNEYVKLI